MYSNERNYFTNPEATRRLVEASEGLFDEVENAQESLIAEAVHLIFDSEGRSHESLDVEGLDPIVVAYKRSFMTSLNNVSCTAEFMQTAHDGTLRFLHYGEFVSVRYLTLPEVERLEEFFAAQICDLSQLNGVLYTINGDDRAFQTDTVRAPHTFRPSGEFPEAWLSSSLRSVYPRTLTRDPRSICY